MENQQIELCALIARLLRNSDDPRIESVSIDGGIDGQRVAITVWVPAAETIPPKISE